MCWDCWKTVQQKARGKRFERVSGLGPRTHRWVQIQLKHLIHGNSRILKPMWSNTAITCIVFRLLAYSHIRRESCYHVPLKNEWNMVIRIVRYILNIGEISISEHLIIKFCLFTTLMAYSWPSRAHQKMRSPGHEDQTHMYQGRG